MFYSPHKFSFRIEIPEPCTQDFDAMPRTGDTLHCSLCAKPVIDYRGKSKYEIAEIQLRQPGGCGIFTTEQMRYEWTISPPEPLLKRSLIAAFTIASVIFPALGGNPNKASAQSTKPHTEKPSTVAGAKKSPAKSTKPRFILIRGRITDALGSPVPNARIYIKLPKGKEYISDTKGNFRVWALEKLANKSVTLVTQADGYVRKLVKIKLPGTGSLNIGRIQMEYSTVFGETTPEPVFEIANAGKMRLNNDDNMSVLKEAQSVTSAYKVEKDGSIVARTRLGFALHTLKFMLLNRPAHFFKKTFSKKDNINIQ